MKAALIVVACLVICPAAGAVTVQDVVQTVAGRGGDIRCLSDQEWRATMARYNAPPTAVAATFINEGRVLFSQRVCEGLNLTGPLSLGAALYVAGHEAAHLRGIRSEAEASCWGLLWATDLARRLYGIEFFSAPSQRIMDEALAAYRAEPDDYHAVCG